MNPNHRSYLIVGEIVCVFVLAQLGWEWYFDGLDPRNLMGAALGLPFHVAFFSLLTSRRGTEVTYLLPGKVLAAFLAVVAIAQGLAGQFSLERILPSLVIYFLVNSLGAGLILVMNARAGGEVG